MAIFRSHMAGLCSMSLHYIQSVIDSNIHILSHLIYSRLAAWKNAMGDTFLFSPLIYKKRSLSFIQGVVLCWFESWIIYLLVIYYYLGYLL